MSKTYDLLKSVVKNNVELEYYHVMDNKAEECCDEDAAEYKIAEEKSEEICKTLKENLPKELHGLVNDLIDTRQTVTSLSQRYYFKQGVIIGLTDLKYLQEVGSLIVLI